MEMFMSLLLLTLGFIMLVKGADWFVEGALAFLLYFVYLIIMAKRGNAIGKDMAHTGKFRLWHSVLGTIAGLILMIAGSDVAVEAARPC